MVYVEAPSGWAARQMLLTSLERQGYSVEMRGIGDAWRLYLS
jgi:hypothetical protein